MNRFSHLYRRLNSEQKAAVDQIDGPVMVVAGPGTGKTQILMLRIANILRKTDTEPKNILALTFTESAATTMRRRLADVIGAAAYSAVIETFHGFCNDVIKSYPDDFPHIIGARNISEIEQIEIMEEGIKTLELKELKPFGNPVHHIPDILRAINNLKREGVDPGQFQSIIDGERVKFDSIDDLYHERGTWKGQMKGEYQILFKQIQKNAELSKIYSWYQKALRKRNVYDYSDMIMEVLSELKKNPNLLLMLQEQHQYILVDEHQDTNSAQNKVLELLCNFHPNPNIFIVGDEKQAIFRFQGASLENFRYFKKIYPKARLVILQNNYRSSQNILDSAHCLIPSPKKLKSMGKKGKTIRVAELSNIDAEATYVANDISNNINNGLDPEDVVILFRENKDAEVYARPLEKIGIPFTIESDFDITSDPDISKLILIFRAVDSFGSDQILAEVLHIDFLGLDEMDVYKVINHAQRNKILIYDVMRGQKIIQSLNLTNPEKFQNLYIKMSSWAKLAKNNYLPLVFESVIAESGFVSHILSLPNATDKMDKIDVLFDEAKNLNEGRCRLSDFMKYVNTLCNHGLMIKGSHQSSRGVRIMTAHRAKGQEFESVYITGAFDGHWGNKRRHASLKLPDAVFSVARSDANDNSDERRLFYVSITRARKDVTITYPKEINGKEQLPCQFIAEIRGDLISYVDTADFEANYKNKVSNFSVPLTNNGPGIKNMEYIREIFLKNGLSVTALNNYLDCPWKFFYTNLIRLPRAKNKHQMYGTAIHSSLQTFFSEFRTDDPGKNYLLEKFSHAISREGLTDSELSECLDKGKNSLSGYYDTYASTWNRNVISEFNIPAVMIDKNIRLTGKIDKIEYLNGKNEVNVVDYKTGRPKSRNEIEGKTKNSNGDIFRQVVFYNLLLNNMEKGRKYRMISAEIDFVEPDPKGKYRREKFFINNDDVSSLNDQIKQVSNDILNLNFWDSECEKKDCEFCAIRKLM